MALIPFLFKRLPTRAAVYIGTAGAFVFVALKWLFGTQHGLLAAVALLYAALWYWSPSRPLGPEELLQWFIALDSDAKTLVVGGILTVIGFFVAHSSIHRSWTRQKRIELKLGLANALEAFYDEANTLLTKIQIYADLCTVLVDQAQADPYGEDTRFRSWFLVGQSVDVVAARNRLGEMSREVHRLTYRDAMLAASSKLQAELERAADLLTAMTDEMFFALPGPGVREWPPERVAQFIDRAGAARFSEVKQRISPELSRLTGHIRGGLTMEVQDVNASLVGYFFAQRKGMVEHITEMRRWHAEDEARRERTGREGDGETGGGNSGGSATDS